MYCATLYLFFIEMMPGRIGQIGHHLNGFPPNLTNRFLYLYDNFHEFYKSSKSFYNTHVLRGNARPTCGPLAQKSSSSASSTCTSTASPPAIATSSGSIWSISDPGIHRATCLGMWVGSWQPCHTRIMQVPVGHPPPPP